MDNNYIYLVFSKTGSWLSRSISIAANIKYAHISISFDATFSELYSFGRRKPHNPIIGGFVKESFYEGFYKRFTASECLIYRVAVTNDQYIALKKEIELYYTNKEKYRYNFLGLIFLLVNKPIKRKNHYFCSQFISELLIKYHLYKSEKCPELIKPNELLEIQNAELIYEGFIKDYSRYIDNIIDIELEVS